MFDARSHLPRRRRRRAQVVLTLALCWLLFLSLSLFPFLLPASASAAPSLILPTPPGQPWKIIQGYGCGTHNSWDRFSLDLAAVNGATLGAPVRAVADGRVWVHDGSSGTLILDHGGQFYTMYTHMRRIVSTQAGTFFAQGAVIGEVGEIGTWGNPHLHFTAFTASGYGMRSWRSLPLSFAEGYELPEIGGCNQHFGKELIAGGLPAPEISFSTSLEPGRWYNADARIEFFTRYAGAGLGQAWNGEPPADAPMFPSATAGYAQLADKGEGWHTLVVRAFAHDGQTTLASFGPLGYDLTPPEAVEPVSMTIVLSHTATTLRWPAARDQLSGVAGYRIYLGSDLNGTSDWFVDEAALTPENLSPGRYILRVQPIDRAGNPGRWTSVATVEVRP